MGGFLGGLQEQLSSTFGRKHQEELDRRKKLQDFYMGAIINSPDEQTAQHAQDEYNKLSSPEAKKGMAGAFPLIRHFGGLHRQQQAQAQTPTAPPQLPQQTPQHIPLTASDNQQGSAGPESQEPQQPFTVIDQTKAFNAGPKAASAPPSPVQDKPLPAATVAQNPIQQFNQGPQQPPPQAAKPQQTAQQFNHGPVLTGMYPTQDQKRQRQIAVETAEDQRYTTKGQALGLTGRDLALFVGSRGQKLPTIIRPTVTADRHRQLADDFFRSENLPDTEEGHAEAERLASEEEVRQNQARGVSSMQQTWFTYPGDKPETDPHAVRVDPKHPNKMVDASTGEPVPQGAAQVNPALAAAKIRQNSYGQFGNLFRALKGKGYNDDDASRLAGEQVEAEYNKRLSVIGAPSTHEALGQNAAGESISIPLQRTVIPNATAPIPPTLNGPTGGAQAPVPAPAGPTASSVPSSGSAKPISAPPTAVAAPVRVPASLAPRILPGVSPAAARIAAQYSVPVTESVVQLFSGPKALINYAHLADDPGASARLGKAINLTRASLGDGIADAAVGAGAGGLHVSSGGFGTWLQNAMGVPGSIANQNAAMLRQALTDLTPEEREAYDATMSEMSVMAGLRSLSKSSAAVANIKLIENEMAKIGTTASSTQFYDQLERVGKAINNAVKTPGLFPKVLDPKTGKTVPVGISPDLVKTLDDLPNRIADLKKNAGPVKAPQGKNNLKSKSTEDLLKMLK